MNIGIVLENHRWFDILPELMNNTLSCEHFNVFNMDHSFIRIVFGTHTFIITIGMGASIAVSMAEKLIEDLECSCIIRIGTAGSFDTNIRIGDVAIAYSGIKGEGTSAYYIPAEVPILSNLVRLLSFQSFYNSSTTVSNSSAHLTAVYTTDGRWKERKDQIEVYKRLGIKTIDMESTALLAMGMDKGIDVISLSIITDAPLEDSDDSIGLIKEGVWENIIVPTFRNLFAICVKYFDCI